MKKIYFVKADLLDEYPINSSNKQEAIFKYLEEIFDETLPTNLKIEKADKEDYHLILRTEDLKNTFYYKINYSILFLDKLDSYKYIKEVNNESLSELLNSKVYVTNDYNYLTIHDPLNKKIFGVKYEN